MTTVPRPLPTQPAYEAPYWEGTRQHELRLQRCAPCGRIRYPFSPVCPDCLSEETIWFKASGRGTISSWITYDQAFQPYFTDKVPYVVGLVDLEEGPRMAANIVDTDPDALEIGQPVEVVFEQVTDEVTLPQFRPLHPVR